MAGLDIKEHFWVKRNTHLLRATTKMSQR